MNRGELAAMAGHEPRETTHVIRAATHLTAKHGKPVFVTLAEHGIVGAAPGKEAIHRNALPLRGEIDIVGAGDSVTANLTAALAAGAEIDEAVEMAVAASSIVIHQLGTTGTASPHEIESLMNREGLLK